MKNLTRYLLLLFLAVNISTNYNAQVIYNGGFEGGDIQGYLDHYYTSGAWDRYYVSGDYIDNWERANNPNNDNNNLGHSPDWNTADFNSNNQFTRYSSTGQNEFIPAHSGSGFIDMGNNELIQQKFNKTELMQQIADAQYVVDPKFRLKFSLHISSNGIEEGTSVKVILSKNKLTYKVNNDDFFYIGTSPITCRYNDGWKKTKKKQSKFKANSKEVIFSVNNLLNQFGNSEWYQIDELIDIPEDIDDYKWISFHVVKKYKKYKKRSPENGGWPCNSNFSSWFDYKRGWLEEEGCCSRDFVMLDDISLAVEECEETCNNTDGKHEFLVSNLIANNENIVIDELSNITKLSIAVVSLTGQLIYQNQVECLNGIDHPIYYDGLGISNGTYYCEITAENDCYTTKRTIGFVKSAPYIGPNVTNFSQGCSNGVNPTPEICCELQGGDNYTINNQILVGPPYSEYLVRDGIYACNATNTFSDEVRVNNGSNILFRAGLEIELNEGFQTQQGAVFLAEIAPSHCDRPAGRGSKYKNEKIKNEDKERAELPNIENSNEISAFPNPSNGTFNVEALNAVSENVLIEVFDMLGSRCYSKEQAGFKQIQISLENVNKGVFFVKVTSANKSLSTKLIIH